MEWANYVLAGRQAGTVRATKARVNFFFFLFFFLRCSRFLLYESRFISSGNEKIILINKHSGGADAETPLYRTTVHKQNAPYRLASLQVSVNGCASERPATTEPLGQCATIQHFVRVPL